jgi:hypothetical protein
MQILYKNNIIIDLRKWGDDGYQLHRWYHHISLIPIGFDMDISSELNYRVCKLVGVDEI